MKNLINNIIYSTNLNDYDKLIHILIINENMIKEYIDKIYPFNDRLFEQLSLIRNCSVKFNIPIIKTEFDDYIEYLINKTNQFINDYLHANYEISGINLIHTIISNHIRKYGNEILKNLGL